MADGFQLLYSALDGRGTVQLWTTDGTATGTVALTHVQNDWGGLFAEDITGYAPGSGLVGAVFRGIDSGGNPSLWITDGTTAGTAELHAAGAAAAGLDPKAMIALGDQILFTGTDSDGRSAIWATDGTDAGTVELGAIEGAGPSLADPQSVLSGERAFFVAGGQLMVSDGTAAGTAQLAGGLDTAEGGPSIAAIPGGVLFAAGERLWASDGTAPGTHAIGSPHARIAPQDIVSFGAGALFRGTDPAGNTQLWFTNGTVAGTHALTAFTAGNAPSWPSSITALSDHAVFFAADPSGIMQLWSTDGTVAGTGMLSAVQDPAGLGLTPGMIATIGGRVLFTSMLGGVWGTDGTSAGTFSTGGAVVYPSAAVADDGLIVATGGADGLLVKIDGANGGSHVLAPAPYATGLTVLRGGAPLVEGGALPCFLPGTRLLTYRGDIAVEALQLGDLMWTGLGGWQELRWIGRGRATIGDSEDHPARPVLIRAGALGEGVPRRDLRLTQGHCLLFPDAAGPGALLPAALLVNGVSILLEAGTGAVDYYHVGLARHDVVLAEGAACESWLDDGANPPFDAVPPDDIGIGPPCAPKHLYGAHAVTIWRALRARAGCMAETGGTADPGLHLLADGRIVAPDFSRDGIHRFTLPRRPRDLCLASRTVVPAVDGLGPDLRRLGVGIREIVVAQDGILRRFGPDDPALAEGFHPVTEGEGLRWTCGVARLDPARLRLGRGRFRMQVAAVALAAYPEVAP